MLQMLQSANLRQCPQTPADVLDRLIEMFEQPGTWTQGALACTRSGEQIGVWENEAATFCADGGILLFSFEGENGKKQELVDRTRKVVCGAMRWWDKRRYASDFRKETIRCWNDEEGRTVNQVLKLLRRARAAA